VKERRGGEGREEGEGMGMGGWEGERKLTVKWIAEEKQLF
jgi:hypothetical protein